jgi:hypothetical protein
MKKGDKDQFGPFAESLCDAACRNHVPRFLFLSIPYVERFVLGKTVTMKVFDSIEVKLRERIAKSTTFLTVARLSEMSEMGHLMEMVSYLHFWPYVPGYDVQMQPISARDFGLAVVDYCKSDKAPEEYLVGGPQIVRWSEFREIVSSVIGKDLWSIPVPLLLLRFWEMVLTMARVFTPILGTICDLIKLATIPMLSDTRNDDFVTFGSDRIQEVLLNHQETYVKDKLKQARTYSETK